MGQFDSFVERSTNPPPMATRVFCVVLPILWIVKAARSRHLEDILIAAWFVVLMLPSGIAPKAYPARLATLDRRPIISSVFMFLLMTTGAFVLLAHFLPRATAVLIGVPFGLVLTITGQLVRRRRT
ncbi:hypothetical protein EV645_4427 [Kribbella rubisoli]|uniref:Uncharacterized protein n=1 Tax=Kribbella rubisoli TaxID=3075929 RepID=A0A4Q7WTA2_9ACTN|nr:hypothetical protein [Kribbella rubisoli]RZU13581.1 hypothetical protein EV645_4427 [Kribbella rubisoli]